ncbi:hypothetical protein FA15DRAFT_372356 [Coprinopsis marcescibilis]|uniref:Nephrocystin 3-like N-terminal domain-containing protein n=1 Tax=Coprinopsis marcescibilis TaxID=230819 RepID=A0A5C3KWR8_COPMA|nr:hypothetical protein FA15DRAFT_372356 [Coprinopsis marcescibilis]
MSILPDAQNITLNNCQLTSIAGDFNVINNLGSDAITATLFTYIAANSMHDSMRRSDAPRCDILTREAVQTDIMAWLCQSWDVALPMDLLWLTGVAGTGKSAIAQSIAETCARQGILAATFFFSFRSQETNNYGRLVTTLAYQLALKIPSTREFIAFAITNDVSIVQKDFQTQFDILIIEPLVKAQGQALDAGEPWPHVIIIDGLDECMDEKQQAAILKAIDKSLEARKLPFKVFIASRPETVIRKYFAGIGTNRVRRIHLDEDYDAASDIKLYLKSWFNTIRVENNIEEAWPTESQIKLLVDNSSGQFIYASTVIKYVNDRSRQPEARLREVLQANVEHGGVNPLSPLEALYMSILKRCPDPMKSAMALRVIHRVERDTSIIAAKAVNHFLGWGLRDWARVFDSLHSLLSIPPFETDDPKAVYKVYHKSLLDFLQSPNAHAHQLHIPDNKVASRISTLYLKMVAKTESGQLAPKSKLYMQYMAPHEFLSCCDMKDRELSHMMTTYDVDWWTHIHLLDTPTHLDAMYNLVHHVDLGCTSFKCSYTCRRWRKGIVSRCRIESEKVVLPSWGKRLQLKWSSPLEGERDEQEPREKIFLQRRTL